MANPNLGLLVGMAQALGPLSLVRARLQQFTVRAKLAGLGLTDTDVADAVAWARKAP